MEKNPPANAGDIRDAGSIPELGRSPGGGNDYPLQYSCLENPIGRGAWQAMVHSIAENIGEHRAVGQSRRKHVELGVKLKGLDRQC